MVVFWFFGHEAHGLVAPWPGIQCTPPALEGEVLIIGPPGKNLIFLQIWNKGNFYINYGPDFYFSKRKIIPLDRTREVKILFEIYYILLLFLPSKWGIQFIQAFQMMLVVRATCQYRRHEMWIQSLGGEDPVEERMATHTSPVFLPGKSHGQKSLVGCNP